jgi:hypothetical protein
MEIFLACPGQPHSTPMATTPIIPSNDWLAKPFLGPGSSGQISIFITGKGAERNVDFFFSV